LCDQLLGEINCQLEAKNITMTEGRINIIYPTPVESAQSDLGKDRNAINRKYYPISTTR
jgi:hypothetical protein